MIVLQVQSPKRQGHKPHQRRENRRLPQGPTIGQPQEITIQGVGQPASTQHRHKPGSVVPRKRNHLFVVGEDTIEGLGKAPNPQGKEQTRPNTKAAVH